MSTKLNVVEIDFMDVVGCVARRLINSDVLSRESWQATLDALVSTQKGDRVAELRGLMHHLDEVVKPATFHEITALYDEGEDLVVCIRMEGKTICALTRDEIDWVESI